MPLHRALDPLPDGLALDRLRKQAVQHLVRLPDRGQPPYVLAQLLHVRGGAYRPVVVDFHSPCVGSHSLCNGLLDRLLVHAQDEDAVVQGEVDLQPLQQAVGRLGLAAVDVVDEDGEPGRCAVLPPSGQKLSDGFLKMLAQRMGREHGREVLRFPFAFGLPEPGILDSDLLRQLIHREERSPRGHFDGAGKSSGLPGSATKGAPAFHAAVRRWAHPRSGIAKRRTRRPGSSCCASRRRSSAPTLPLPPCRIAAGNRR